MRLLVIEDYQVLRESVVQGLSEAGFQVDSTGDGADGLWLAKAGVYEVVILDLMLPGMDGLSVLRKMRELSAPPCVLVLTAKDSTENRVAGLNAGADDYLVKPFAFPELLARIHALIRRKNQIKSTTLQIADMELDMTRRVVRRGGREIKLSSREYALLELMALRAGKVVTRTMIWESVYEQDSAAESNVVDVFIGHLRRKIDLDGLPKLIHTRRGHGYVLGESA